MCTEREKEGKAGSTDMFGVGTSGEKAGLAYRSPLRSDACRQAVGFQ